jgi:serine/threonine protein kinase
MRQIDHPNLIKMQEVFETDNSLYIIMNYYEGENLLELLK